MDEEIVLPAYADEELAGLSPAELIDVVIENEDRVPRNLIDECARRGDAMTEYLSMLHRDDFLWDDESGDGVWWLRLHAPMILGQIPGEAAGLLLVELMRRMSLDGDDDVQDWLAGYWPALFKNKPDSALSALRGLSEDRDIYWYMRVNAVEPIMAAAYRQGCEASDQALAWLANLVTDETEDWDFRLSAADILLDYPHPEYRTLLENMATRQTGLGKHFDEDDVRKAYEDTQPRQDRFSNPWKFYEPDAIAKRQIRWREEDELEEKRVLKNIDDYLDYDSAYHNEPYVRSEPKVGRNDPCPCGSGKKYKKCCLANA